MSEVNLIITIVWMMTYRLRKLVTQSRMLESSRVKISVILEPLLAVPKQLFNHLGALSQIMDQMEIKIFAA